MRIGFIGAGRMGRPMVENLMAAGHDVAVLVRQPDARAVAEADGWTCVDSVGAAAAEADALIVAVLTDAQVRAVCLGVDGAVAAMPAGSTVVLHTTCDPDTAIEISKRAAKRGIGMLDAALSGSVDDVRSGQLTLWIGGDDDVLARIRPLLETYASPIMHLGAVGTGQRVKLINNALFVSQVGLAIQAVRVATALGIEESAVLAAVAQGSGASRALELVKSIGSVSRVSDRLSDLMSKDVRVVLDIAARAGIDLGVLEVVLTSDAVQSAVLTPR
jgi:3-hydroxyisobutyrate dehydrogenase-like beta-hydroxyacid dehydrogenase